MHTYINYHPPIVNTSRLNLVQKPDAQQWAVPVTYHNNLIRWGTKVYTILRP